MIPTPKFVVFYNGSEKRPPVEYLRFSDMFEKETDDPEIEIICTVYNINSGCNEDLLSRCPVMEEYMALINKIRELIIAGDEEPIRSAIEYCIAHDILKDFLTEKGPEVEKTMAIDMTWETREKLIRRDEFEDGFEQGMTQQTVFIIKNMLQNGFSIEDISVLVKHFCNTLFDKYLSVSCLHWC